MRSAVVARAAALAGVVFGAAVVKGVEIGHVNAPAIAVAGFVLGIVVVEQRRPQRRNWRVTVHRSRRDLVDVSFRIRRSASGSSDPRAGLLSACTY
jgi:hypothetical protein